MHRKTLQQNLFSSIHSGKTRGLAHSTEPALCLQKKCTCGLKKKKNPGKDTSCSGNTVHNIWTRFCTILMLVTLVKGEEHLHRVIIVYSFLSARKGFWVVFLFAIHLWKWIQQHAQMVRNSAAFTGEDKVSVSPGGAKKETGVMNLQRLKKSHRI